MLIEQYPYTKLNQIQKTEMSSKYDDDDDEYESKDEVRRAEAKLDSYGNEMSQADEKGLHRLTRSELLLKVQEYFYGDEILAKTFEAFVDSKSSIVDEESEEYKLQYTEAYDEFKAMFEEHIESYIVRNLGSSITEFYLALKEKTEEDENSNEAIFGQILLAVTDFDIFMKMMRESAYKIRSSRK